MISDVSPDGYPARDAPEHEVTERRVWVYRHPVPIRICHWINALCLMLMIMSGLQIFNAHPALYRGSASDFDHPLMSITNVDSQGVTTVFGHSMTTTGLLGLSYDANGAPVERAFPGWLTVPSDRDLATGRRWHFFFAWLLVINGLVYVIYGVLSRQLAYRLLPTRDQFSHLGRTLREHVTLNFPTGREAKRYNLLQKLTYLAVVGMLLPIQILTGLTMSPGMDSAFPFLLTLFGGRQSARTIHFLIMDALIVFIVIHVAMVFAAGLWNNMRGMISGWFVTETTKVGRGDS